MTTTWSRDEILILIEVWGDDIIQAQLNGCKRNQDIFDKISSALLETGFVRSGSQCRDKTKKLRGEYHKVKDKRDKTDPEWDYFDAILGHRPATRPPVVVNSIADSEEVDEQDSPHSPERFPDDALSTSTSSCATSVSPSDPQTGPLKTSAITQHTSRKRKRPNSVVEKVESVTAAIITKLSEMQKLSDDLIRDLEGKRLKFEERQAEREEEQRRQERQFQLQMMQMMMGSSSQSASNMHMQFPYGSMRAFSPFQDDN